MNSRDLCICGHQRVAHRKSESFKAAPADADKLSRARQPCALCYCSQFKVERKPSAATQGTPGKTLYRRSDAGGKFLTAIPGKGGDGKRAV
jgi:hypothetical protein